MNQREEEYVKDKRYVLVKEVFHRNLHERKDVEISLEDAEETFRSL